MRVETKTELVADNGKRFRLFSDIAFSQYNKKTNHLDHVICRIIAFIAFKESDYEKNNGYIIGDKIEINHGHCDLCQFYFKDMKDIQYVYYD